MKAQDIVEEINLAESRIRPYTLTTPLMESRALGKMIEAKVYLKLESEQHTGSFKARGSLNKILSLSEEERKRGIITASTGNHAQGCARAMEISGANGTIYLPTNAAPSKVKALRSYDAELQFYGSNSLETELYAKAEAKAQGRIWISPYDDPQIIGGQGTIGIELCQQLDQFDHVLICVGGGGLISGIGAYLKMKRPEVQIVGCLPEHSPEMALSLEKGEVIQLEEFKETLSDGSAGGLEKESITFPIGQEVIDKCILVSEEAIAEGIKFAAHTHKKIIEGAAAVPIAALLKEKKSFKGGTVILIICGANIDTEKFKQLI